MVSHLRHEQTGRTCWLYLEAAGDVLENLGDVLAHLAHRAVAVGRGARLRGLVEERCARQMRGEIPARLFCSLPTPAGLRPALSQGVWLGRGLALGFGLGLGGLEFLKLQLELLDLAPDGSDELPYFLAPEPGELVFELLDLQRVGDRPGLGG